MPLYPDHRPQASQHFRFKKRHSILHSQLSVMMLLDYNFSIKYQSSSNISQAYALSRLISSHCKLPEDTVVAVVFVEPEVVLALVSTVRTQSVMSQMIQKATNSDSLLQKVPHFHFTNQPTVCADRQFQPFLQHRSLLMEPFWLMNMSLQH